VEEERCEAASEGGAKPRAGATDPVAMEAVAVAEVGGVATADEQEVATGETLGRDAGDEQGAETCEYRTAMLQPQMPAAEATSTAATPAAVTPTMATAAAETKAATAPAQEELLELQIVPRPPHESSPGAALQVIIRLHQPRLSMHAPGSRAWRIG